MIVGMTTAVAFAAAFLCSRLGRIDTFPLDTMSAFARKLGSCLCFRSM
jgi:hypothetical protein